METKEETVEVALIDVSQVELFDPVSVTTPALHALASASSILIADDQLDVGQQQVAGKLGVALQENDF